MRQLSKKKTEWKWTDRKRRRIINDIKKLVKEIPCLPCLARFARDRYTRVTKDASRTRLEISLWQIQTDNTIRPVAFAGSYLNDAEKNFLMGELKLLTVVWGMEIFRFCLYCKVVYLYTDHQAVEPLIKRNRVY